MKTYLRVSLPAVVCGLVCTTAFGAVRVRMMTPVQASPQPIGTSISWTVEAVDSVRNPLTFQFNVAAPGQPFAVMKDFNVGIKKSGVWTPARPFVWTPTGPEGMYRIQVVAKDFTSGQSNSLTVNFQVNPLMTGSTPVVVTTANPLVALFSSPSCPAGSSMRVSFQQASQATPATMTNWVPCNPPYSMTFEIGGMYPSTAYQMLAQTMTGSTVVSGPMVTYTTGALPSKVPFPSFKVLTPVGPHTDTVDGMLMTSVTRLGGGVHYPDVATDMQGNVMWYYYPDSSQHSNLLTRPLQNGGVLSQETDTAWVQGEEGVFVLRQLDLAGNIVRETNTGILQHQLLAMGVTDAAYCSSIAKPAQVGDACMGSFHHEAMQSLPNGQTAVFADIEKIYPAGTQGDTSGLPVDVIGDIMIVLDQNWQVSWYFDTFEHATGAPQLDINRRAVLGETCTSGQGGCPRVNLLGTGIAPKATDWLHANSIYYWPQTGDILWSSRHQDWIMRINYQNGTGDGTILWRMGPGGDFQFDNKYKDKWPWFSHQHEIAMENDGAGPLTIFDNGNTRVSKPGVSTGGTPGLGSNCKPHDCHSRGMAVTFDETQMTVSPVLSQDLGYYSTAMGSAELLSNGNYFFVPAIVLVGANTIDSYSIQIEPTTGDSGARVFNMQGTEVYRGWEMPDLYHPPIS